MVNEAVRRELESMPAMRDGMLAAMVLALAAELDKPENSATAKAMCARALVETFRELRANNTIEEADRLDELGTRRADRLARGARAQRHLPAGGREFVG